MSNVWSPTTGERECHTILFVLCVSGTVCPPTTGERAKSSTLFTQECFFTVPITRGMRAFPFGNSNWVALLVWWSPVVQAFQASPSDAAAAAETLLEAIADLQRSSNLQPSARGGPRVGRAARRVAPAG